MEIHVTPSQTPQDVVGYTPSKKHHIGCFFVCALIFLLFLGITGLFVYHFRSYIQVFQNILSSTNRIIPRTATENNLKYTYTGSQFTNILLLGSDNDAKFNPANVLTQTDIIISINTKDKVISMISLPRDFWIPVDGVSGGYAKLDEVSGYGGFGLTRQVIEKDFGIHIDYYAWVGLGGFIKVIDTFGGVTLDINHPILDDLYPNDTTGNDPYSATRLYIPSGPIHLDGTTALEYVRSRHGDAEGDFGRSARQQQVLLTLKDKVISSDLVDELPILSNELKDSVRTDMSITTITQFAPILADINGYKINRYILDPPDFATNAVSDSGKDIVQPNMQKINALFNQIFVK